MKFNFKKISAVVSTVLLAGMTLGAAASISTPSAFASGAIVMGSGTGVSDGTAQSTITNYLSEFVEGTTVSLGDDFVQIEKAQDLFNLGDNLNSFYTSLDDDELSVILKSGTYKNDDNDEFEYDQEIVLGSMTLTHFVDTKFNNKEPVIGFDLSGGDTILNYTLDFVDDAESDETDWNSFEGTTIEILGKEYYILSASNTSGSETLELLDSATDAVLNEGETTTLTTGGDSYEVSIGFIGTDSVKLIVNGETTSSLAQDDTYKLNSGEYIGIKEINTQDYQGGVKQVEFSIGSGKIELVHGEEIQVNNEDVSDLYEGYTLNSYFTQSSNNLASFTIEWELDSGSSNDNWLGFGTDSTGFIMPVFNNLQLSLGDFVTEVEEMTTVEPDGDDGFTLETTVTDGDVTLNLLYANSTGTGFAGIGASATELLVTNGTADSRIEWNENSTYFVATWINGDDYESYVLEVTDIDDSTPAKNTTKITSVGSGDHITLDIDEADEIGQIEFTLVAANEEDETASIVLDVAGSASGTVTADKLVTAEGLKIQLPQDESVSSAGGINFTVGAATQTSWTMNFTEETESGNIDEGDSFSATLGFNDDETSVTAVSVTDYETTDDSNDYIGYVASELATKTMFYTGGEQDSIEITYYGEEAYAEIFVSELGATSTTSAGVLVVKDTETSAFAGKNIVVVGGSAINSVAAELLGLTYPTFGADFTAATGVGANQYMVKEFDYNGKVAVLVAGYEAADTAAAANLFITGLAESGEIKTIGAM